MEGTDQEGRERKKVPSVQVSSYSFSHPPPQRSSLKVYYFSLSLSSVYQSETEQFGQPYEPVL